MYIPHTPFPLLDNATDNKWQGVHEITKADIEFVLKSMSSYSMLFKTKSVFIF